VREVAREQGTQLFVILEAVIEAVDEFVDCGLTADPVEEIRTTERPETRRMLQKAPMLKRCRIRSGRRGDVQFRSRVGAG